MNRPVGQGEDTMRPRPRKGRGAIGNPDNRYDPLSRAAFDDGWDTPAEEEAPLRTTVERDAARSVLTFNDSPDLPFDRSVNPYRGCEHGCVYCYARPTHAYLGLSPGLDFETRLFCKPEAAELLARELGRPGYRCAPIALGVNTDAWQPVERRLRITRAILEALLAFRHPVTVITKSALIERDLDLLAALAERRLVAAAVSVTTLDRDLARRLEPRATAPERRIETIRRLHDAGVPVGIMVAPVIPVLTDGEIERILQVARVAGASWAGYVLLRLPLEVSGLFQDWLAAHAPLAASHVMSRVREARGGRENDPRFGARMRGSGPYADMIAQRFRLACRRLGLDRETEPLDCTQFRVPPRQGEQLELFGDDNEGR